MSTIYLVAVALLGLAAWAGYVNYRSRRMRKAMETVTAAIVDYFARSRVAVSAGCIAAGTPRTPSFIAFVESEPLKRFRYSHIVEASLIDHIQRKTGLQVEKVYWRFPLSARPGGDATAPAASTPDDYVAEGLSRLKTGHDYEVEEGSWGDFEQALKPGGTERDTD
ncbi:MAG: hypothetical protein AB1768_02490 [Pseudomonadota bacterium]|jgi:hypothetical protein